MSSLEQYRFDHLKVMSNIPSFRTSWGVFEPEIRNLLGPNPTALDVRQLGSHLGAVFQSNSQGRTQAGVSAAGTVWECLVAWYLNLILAGTHAVVVKPTQRFLPPSISNATAVTIGNLSTNTESDLIGFQIPENSSIADYGFVTIEEAIRSAVGKSSVTVIQCKTNWNDNAQIPMLWGMIYDAAGSIRLNNVAIGSNGIFPQAFKNFRYAFVTVPTSNGNFSPTSLQVLRVSALSGGNYWGRPTQAGVAKSLSELLGHNFPSAFAAFGSIDNSLQTNLISRPGLLEKFLSLDF